MQSVFEGFETYIERLVAGAAAGMTAELLLFFFEIRNYPSVFNTNQNPAPSVGWRRTINFKELARQFWSTAWTKAPVAGLVIASYDLFKGMLNVWLARINQQRKDSLPDELSQPQWEKLVLGHPLSLCCIAGFSAQMLEAFLMNPIFVLRDAHLRRCQRETPKMMLQRSVVQTIGVVLREGGLVSFWRGYWSSVASGAPFISCYYASAEMFGQMIARRYGYASAADLPIHLNALTGGCGAALAVVVTTPCEILRQRLLTEWKNWNQTKEVLLREGPVQERTPSLLKRESRKGRS